LVAVLFSKALTTSASLERYGSSLLVKAHIYEKVKIAHIVDSVYDEIGLVFGYTVWKVV
jgi:hypothetical protein